MSFLAESVSLANADSVSRCNNVLWISGVKKEDKDTKMEG